MFGDVLRIFGDIPELTHPLGGREEGCHKAAEVCRSVLPGIRTGLSLHWFEFVDMHCSYFLFCHWG